MNSIRKITIRAVCIFFAIYTYKPANAAPGNTDYYDSHGMFRLGILNYTKSDTNQTLKGSASVMNYEYSRAFRTDQAIVLGWKQATEPATKLDAYHAAYGGYRIFPMGIGLPILVSTGDGMISYDSKFKPYAEVTLGLGHMQFQPDTTQEFGTDTLSVAFGGGVLMHFFGRWAFDISLMYEKVQQRGGTSQALALSANQFYLLIGNGVLF